jgi:hypothetical protein
MCLLPWTTGVDDAGMTITAEHIYHRTCEECDRPALTFDRDDRALCPTHAKTIVKAQPVKDEFPVTNPLSG